MSEQKPRAAIFIDTDVVIRHFLDSGAFTALSERFDITLVFPEMSHPRVAGLKNAPERWGWPHRFAPMPPIRVMWWKRLFYLDQLRPRRGADWRATRRFYRRVIGCKAAIVLSALAMPGLYPIAKRLIRNRIDRNPAPAFDEALAAINPDIVLHPSVFQGLFINDLVACAAAARWPLIVMMNSWDNPSLKRGVVGQPDAVVVWGEQTAQHAHEYMRVARSKIHVFGAAQFQCFRDIPDQSKEQICLEHDVCKMKKIIIYAGSSKFNDESTHLRILDDAIDANEIENAVILYRPHPFFRDKNQAVRILAAEFRHVSVEITMRRHLERVAQGEVDGFFITPYARTHSLLAAADVVLSPMSTILIEAALHGAPPVCIAPLEEDKGSIWRYARDVRCFQELLASPAIRFVGDLAELVAETRAALDASENRSARAALMEHIEPFALQNGPRYGERLRDLAVTMLTDR